MIDRENRKKLKCIRSDNGGEYTFRVMPTAIDTIFSKRRWFVHIKENKWTIMDKAINMINMAKLLKPF